MLLSILPTVKYYEKTGIWRYKAVSPPGSVCLSWDDLTKIPLWESERKWYPQTAYVVILPALLIAVQKAHMHLGYTINFLPLFVFKVNFPLDDLCPTPLPSSTELCPGSQRRHLPTMPSACASAVLDAPPPWSKRDSVRAAAGKRGCCWGKHTQTII